MTYDPFQEINNLPILEALDVLQVSYRKNGTWYVLVHNDGRKDTSFSICTKKNIITDFGKTGISWPLFDFIGQYILKLSKEEMRQSTWRANTLKYAIDKWLIHPPQTNKTFEKTLKSAELLEKLDTFRLGGYKQDISSFLIKRWVEYEWAQKNHTLIWEIFSSVWYYENYYTSETQTDEPRTVSVFMFPCMDQYMNTIWVKLRRKDGKNIRGKKSYAVWKTGLLYEKWVDDNTTVIIVEWEMDYIILRLLWYKNVVWNLGWVQSNKKMLKELLFDIPKIICLYDNDEAWITHIKSLQNYFNREISVIDYPIYKNKEWWALSDVNDYYRAWYDTRKKWDKLLKTAHPIYEDNISDYKYDFVFLRSTLEYYDIKYKKIQQTASVAAMLWKTTKELAAMVNSGMIRTYEDICYKYGWQKWYYNTMDEDSIIVDTKDTEPKLHPHIKKLIDNVWWHKKKNIDWIHQSILYKLTHINDPYVPALILYGEWASGKWSLLNLLSKIFWEKNMLTGLWQRDLAGNFDAYQWSKLIVEFKEVSSGSTFQDKRITDRIKWIINERYITINAKFQNPRQIENIARFHLSSNHSNPLQLDSKHSWNRRFTIIKTGWKLDHNLAREMNEVTFNNKQSIREYIARLYDTYPNVLNMEVFPALDNEEKQALEHNCEESSNVFFERFESNYPSIIRITNKEKNKLLKKYCFEEWEDYDDVKFKQKNFDLWLSHKYEKKRVKVRWKTIRWYYIHKTKYEKEKIPTWEKQEFDKDEVNNMLI